MRLKEWLKALGKEQINQQEQEQKLLEKIDAITSMEFEEQAAKTKEIIAIYNSAIGIVERF